VDHLGLSGKIREKSWWWLDVVTWRENRIKEIRLGKPVA
jgi:hypothetical protein